MHRTTSPESTTTPRTWPCPECRRDLPALEYFGSEGFRGAGRCKDCVAADVAALDGEAETPLWVRRRVRTLTVSELPELGNPYCGLTFAQMVARDPRRNAASSGKSWAAAYGRGEEFAPAEIEALLEKQDGRCHYCHKRMWLSGFHVDHYVPFCRGGGNNLDNIVLACPKCHRKKGTKPPAEFEAALAAAR